MGAARDKASVSRAPLSCRPTLLSVNPYPSRRRCVTRWAGAVVVCAAVGAVGCRTTNYDAAAERDAVLAAVPGSYSDGVGADDGGVEDGRRGLPVPARWWTAFGDAGLNAAVVRAFADNPSLAAAAARVRAARAVARREGAALLPRWTCPPAPAPPAPRPPTTRGPTPATTTSASGSGRRTRWTCGAGSTRCGIRRGWTRSPRPRTRRRWPCRSRRTWRRLGSASPSRRRRRRCWPIRSRPTRRCSSSRCCGSGRARSPRRTCCASSS